MTINRQIRRDVFCLLGLPLDAVTMDEALVRVRAAVNERSRLFLSTPNLNFLIGSRKNAALRDSVINSDLSVADGMPLVWMARLLGLPISERVTGSGLFERLQVDQPPLDGKPIRVYFFGGPPGAAAKAHDSINASAAGLVSVGHASPGFGPIEAMSGDEVIRAINDSGADILVVALGAVKGQAWIEYNLDRLTVPVVSHLGAVVNFAAGTVSRAPVWVQRVGLEWLWRIKEEPSLWRRYWGDGRELLSVLVTCLIPYALWLRLHGHGNSEAGTAVFTLADTDEACRLAVSGDIPGGIPPSFMEALDQAAAAGRNVVVNLAAARLLGAAFWAQLLLLRRRVSLAGRAMRLEGMSSGILRQMRWNGVEFLIRGEAA